MLPAPAFELPCVHAFFDQAGAGSGSVPMITVPFLLVAISLWSCQS